MRLLTSDEAVRWCHEHGFRIDKNGDLDLDNKRTIRIPIPTEPHRLPYLIVQLLDAEVIDDEVVGNDHLLWLKDWSIWPEFITSIGIKILKSLLSQIGATEAEEVAPAISCVGGELKNFVGLSLVPLLFQWDFYIIPATGKYFVFASHDVDWIEVTCAGQEEESNLIRDLEGFR